MADTRGTPASSGSAAAASSSSARSPASRSSFAAMIPLGEHLGKPELPLDRPVSTVGSRETCRLRLSSSTVSKAHALMIQSQGGQIIAADLASRAGILVNGQRLTYGPLRTGDRVQIGKFTFRFRAAPGAAEDAPPPPAAPPAALALADGSASLDIQDQTFLIGRRPNADLPLTDDPSVSTAHAVLFPIDGVWHVRDLNSRTGTRLNGKPVHQHRIDFGDTLQIGSATFRFNAAGTVEAAEAVATAGFASPEFPVPEVAFPQQAGVVEEIAAAPESELLEMPASVEEAAEPPSPEPAPAEVAAAAPDQSPDIASDDFGLDLLPEPAAPGDAAVDADLDGLIFEEPESLSADVAATASEPPDSTSSDIALADEATPPVDGESEPVEAPLSINTEAAGIAPPDELVAEETPTLSIEVPVDEIAIDEPAAAPPPAIEAELQEPGAPRRRRGGSKNPAANKPASRRRGKAGATEPSPPEPAVSAATGSEATEPPAGDAASMEMVEPTEPTPESALALEPTLGPAADENGETSPPAAPAGAENLSDSAFGLAVEAFAGPSTGPLSESAAPGGASWVSPALPGDIEQLGLDEEFVAIPEPESSDETIAPALPEVDAGGAVDPELAADPVADETAPLAESVDVAGSGDGAETLELTPDTAVAGAANPVAGVVNQDVDSSGSQETVASETSAMVEAPVPVADMAGDAAMDEPADAAGPEAPMAADVPEPVAVSASYAEAPVATPPAAAVADEGGEADGSAPAAVATAAEPDAVEPEGMESAPAAPAAPLSPSPGSDMLDESSLPGPEPAGMPSEPGATARGPSIFGFNFDGGSFLGGRPLRLPNPPAPVAPAAAAESGAGGGAAAPIAPTTTTAEIPAEDAAAADAGFNAAAAGAVGPAGMTATETPPPPLMQPMAGPAGPAAAPPAPTPAAPGGLVPEEADLHPPGDDEPGGAIPTLSDEMVVPPLARPVRAAPTVRRPLSTAFDGLSGSTDAATGPLRVTGLIGGVSVHAAPPPPGARPGRSGAPGSEAFSQLAPQISVEVFGSLQGNPDEFIIPEVGEPEPPGGPIPRPAEDFLAPAAAPATAARARGGRPAMMPAGTRYPEAIGAEAPPARARHLPVSALLGLMVLCLSAAWVGIYLVIPPRSKVTGTLAFAGLDSQPEPAQRAFIAEQLDRLRSPDVRTVAKDLLVVQHVAPGFLDNSTMLDDAITRDGTVHFDGNALTVTATAGAQEEGSAQVTDLLLALSKKDADLTDALRRAQRHVDSAQQEVTEAAASLKTLNETHRAEQKRGDDRPDPSEISALEAAANRAARLLAVARAARLDIESAITDLHAASTTQPADAVADPQLVRLHWQLSDLNGQIKDLQARTAAATPAAANASGGNGSGSSGPTADADDADGSGAAGGDANGGDTGGDAMFLQKLAEQATAVSHQITGREAALAADQTYTPAQRERAHQKELEDLGVQLADLKRAEAGAQANAAAAGQRLREAYDRLDNARLATLHIDQVISDINVAQDQLKEKSNQLRAAQDEVAGCVTVADEPRVSSVQLPDPRPVAAGVLSGITLLLFCSLILRASRSDSETPPVDDAGLNPAMDGADSYPPSNGSNGQTIDGVAPASAAEPSPAEPQTPAARPIEMEESV